MTHDGRRIGEGGPEGGRRRGNSALSPYRVPSKSISSPGGFKLSRGMRPAGGDKGGPRGIFDDRRRGAGGGFGSASRRRPIPWLPIALIALLVSGIAGGVWLLVRPASVAIAAEPADARITFGTCSPRAGKVATSGLRPGDYRLSIERTGFASLSTTVTLARGQHLERTFRLPPLPQRVTVSSLPTGAAVRIAPARADAGAEPGAGAGAGAEPGAIEPVTGVTPFETTVPAGTMTLTVSNKNGGAGYERTVFLDSPRAFNVVLDPARQAVTNRCYIATTAAPKSVSITPDGSQAWTALLNGPSSIEIVDPATGRPLGSLDLGRPGAVEVIFNRSGTLAFASQMETAKVLMIDVKTRAVVREFSTRSAGTQAVALSPDEKTLYAANWSGNDVSVMDVATARLIKRMPVAKNPRGLWPTADGRYLFVAGFAGGDLQRIDVKTGKVENAFRSGGALRHLVADDKRGLLFASDMSRDVIWVVDTKTLKTRQFAKVDHKPNTIALSADGRILFVSCRGANNPKSYYLPGYEWGTVLLLDATSAKPLDAIIGGNQCTALAVSGNGRTLVFSDFLDNRLRVYAIPSYDKLATGGGGAYQAHFATLVKKTAGTAAGKAIAAGGVSSGIGSSNGAGSSTGGAASVPGN